MATCTDTHPGRCNDNGRRVMVHRCNRFRGHTTTRHRCITCGHTWAVTPKPDTDPEVIADRARRRARKEQR